MRDLARDFYFGWRALRRQPGFTFVAVLTLAVGIGANTAVFSLVDALLWQRLPVRAPDELVLFSDGLFTGTVTGDPPTGKWDLFSSDVYDSLRSAHLPLASIAAVASGADTVTFRIPGRPEGDSTPAARARVQLVSGNYFEVMGAGAATGRTLTPKDDVPGAAPAAVASDRFWRGRLGGDAQAIGRSVMLGDTAFTIVGVAPPAFFGERVQQAPDLWAPLAFQPQIQQRRPWSARPDAYWLSLIGRLAPGTSREPATTAVTSAVQQYLTAHSSQLSEDARKRIADARVVLAEGSGGISDVRQRYGRPVGILLGIVGLMLLVACANVGNLLLVRATARRGEAALRLALGASRGRLMRQWLTESLLLSALGAGTGVLIAKWLAGLLLAFFVPRSTPVHASVDAAVLAFTIGITGVSSLLFGLAPAVRASRTDLLTALRGCARGATARRRRAFGVAEPLVVGQIAISVVVVAGAALLARSLINLERAPLGFDRSRVLLARINPKLAGYAPEQAVALYRRIYDALETLPGVEQVTMARYSPLSGARSVNGARIDGFEPAPNERLALETVLVGPTYPQTLGMAVVGGRAIDLDDRPGRPRVAVVNEAFGRHYAAGASPIGRHIHFRNDDYEIVGVVRDAQFQSPRDAMTPVVFVAMLQESSLMALDCEIEVRTAGDPAALAAPVRGAIAAIDPRLAVTSTRTLAAQVADTFQVSRITAGFVAAFAGLALMLAAIGLYGVVSYGVARRTSEIGVRVALGAARRDVLWLVLGETLVRMTVGLALGLAAAAASGRLIASQLFGVSARDPLTLTLAALVLVFVASVASLLPAVRALRIDPAVALRAE